MNKNDTVHKLYTGNKGWSGDKRHIVSVEELLDGSGFAGRPRTYCSDDFAWTGAKQPTRIKREQPTPDNITCKKCLATLEKMAVR